MQETAGFETVIMQAIEVYSGSPAELLSIFHYVQDRLGYVPASAVPHVARELNLSRAEVHGALSFYPHFRTNPPGQHVIQICHAEACQAMGGAGLAAHAARTLAVGFHETTADGRFTLDPVYCLGNCACSPAIMADGEIHGRVTAERFDDIVRGLGDPS